MFCVRVWLSLARTQYSFLPEGLTRSHGLCYSPATIGQWHGKYPRTIFFYSFLLSSRRWGQARTESTVGVFGPILSGSRGSVNSERQRGGIAFHEIENGHMSSFHLDSGRLSIARGSDASAGCRCNDLRHNH